MEPVQDAEITMTTQAADDGSGAMEESPAKRQARELSTPVPPTAAERLRDKHAPHGRCPFDHSDDVFAAMRRKEVAHFNQRSTYLQYRGVIVEWMCEVAEEFRLHPCALQTSVAYFDFVLQRQAQRKSELQLVAMCCTLLAAKFQGPEEKVPQISELNTCSKNTYSREQIVAMEVSILQTLDWRLDVLTPLHFVDHLLALGVASLDDTLDGAPLRESEKLEKIPRRLRQFSEFFVRLCLENHEFYAFAPSLLAAASVATSRYVLTVQPLWPGFLAARTGYSEAELYPCMQAVLQYSSLRFPQKFESLAAAAPSMGTKSEISPRTATASVLGE